MPNTPSIPEAFIYDAIRTPRGRGKASGSLYTIKPVSLVVGLIDELRARHPDLDPAAIDDLVLGIVSPVGDQGSVLPRTAALVAGLPDTVSGVQLNRLCGSGLEAVNTAAQKGWCRDRSSRHRRRTPTAAATSTRHRLRSPAGPIPSAPGSMLVGTMLDELERRQARRAVITLCIGGGMGVATLIERL